MRALALALALIAAPASAQRLPWFEWPAEGTPAPATTSAATAYAASLGSTAVLVGGGLLVLDATGYWATLSDERPGVADAVGLGLLSLGVAFGPSAGNLLLLGPNEPSAWRGSYLRSYAFAAGPLISLGGLLLCLASVEGGECTNPLVVPLLVAGGAVFAGGIVGGAAYDLAAIPRNAERARAAVRERDAGRAVQVGLAPVGGRPGVFAVVPL